MSPAPGGPRTILHVDMDAFYASVEQLDHPEWAGRPVIVGADPAEGRGRGVVAACSYEARAFGIRSALPIGTAWRLCPQAVFVRPRMRRYAALSKQVLSLLGRYTDAIEPLSIDEAFLDVTGSRRLFGSGAEIGRRIRAGIRAELGLVASVGVAPSKFVAKVASDLEKPDGFVVVESGEERAFLAPLPVSRLWGVGPQTERRLSSMGLQTIGDVARLRPEDLLAALGEQGPHLIRLARGEDGRPVVAGGLQQSIGAETTFERDTADPEVVRRTLLELSDRVAARLRRHGVVAGRVTLKHRDEQFRTAVRSVTLPAPTDLTEGLYGAALDLLGRMPRRESKVRLLGVTAGGLSAAAGGGHPRGAAQLDLFPPLERKPAAQLRKVAEAVDEIRRSFGGAAITRAALLGEQGGEAREGGGTARGRKSGR